MSFDDILEKELPELGKNIIDLLRCKLPLVKPATSAAKERSFSDA